MSATEHIEAARKNREAARHAHDEGRHGDGSVARVVHYWAPLCADCDAIRRYEYGPQIPLASLLKGH